MGRVLAGCGAGLCLISRYPMQWQPKTPHEETELAVQLLELGFPDYGLPAPAAGGDRGLSRGHTGGGQRSGVRPGGRLLPKQRLQPAVHNRGRGKLTGEPAGRMIFHHFLWNTAPPFHGTAAIQLWPVYQSDELWSATGEVAGRVLYDWGGETFWAPYHSLEEDTSPYGYQGIYGQWDIFSVHCGAARAGLCGLCRR